jgi:hypothetical protein
VGVNRDEVFRLMVKNGRKKESRKYIITINQPFII